MSSESQNPGSLAFRTYRWEGAVFNVLCAVYFLFFAGYVVDAAEAAMRDPDAKIIWLGLLLIFISLAEVWAFPVKMRFINEAIRDNGDTSGRAFYLWLFHTVISIILVFMIAGSFGVKVAEGEADNMPWWLQALFPVVVVKELVFLGFMWTSPEEKAAKNPKYTRPKIREWIADAILVVYACVAYSATWTAIVRGMSMDLSHPVMIVLEIFLCTLLFLIFYLPLRIPYWIEELVQVKSGKDVARIVGSILVVLIPVLISLYQADANQ